MILIGLSGRGDKDLAILAGADRGLGGESIVSGAIPNRGEARPEKSAERVPGGRIEAAIRAANQAGRPALTAFLTAGYPSRDTFVPTLRSIATEADVVEVGVPFSDPMADGVTIQRASRAALESGVTLPWILSEIGRADPQTPLVLMSYLNPLLAFGLDTPGREASKLGIDGFIIPDLPFEESLEVMERVEPLGIGWSSSSHRSPPPSGSPPYAPAVGGSCTP